MMTGDLYRYRSRLDETVTSNLLRLDATPRSIAADEDDAFPAPTQLTETITELLKGGLGANAVHLV